MKAKASVIFAAIFMVTAIFAAQSKDVVKQSNNQQVASQSTQQTTKDTRGIVTSKTNWSKIKDMFM